MRSKVWYHVILQIMYWTIWTYSCSRNGYGQNTSALSWCYQLCQVIPNTGTSFTSASQRILNNFYRVRHCLAIFIKAASCCCSRRLVFAFYFFILATEGYWRSTPSVGVACDNLHVKKLEQFFLPWFLCAASVLGQSKGVFCWFQILMWGRHHGCDLYIKGGYLKFSVSKVRFLSGLLILQLQRYPRHLFYAYYYIIGKGQCRNFTYDIIFSTWFIWHSANSARPRQMTQHLLMQP